MKSSPDLEEPLPDDPRFTAEYWKDYHVWWVKYKAGCEAHDEKQYKIARSPVALVQQEMEFYQAMIEDLEKQRRRLALQGLASELASDNLGIYPQSVSGGDQAYEKRTEWMEGWNECATEMADTFCLIMDWIRGCGERVEDLLIDQRLTLCTAGDTITMIVDCSDVFAWGTADCENIALDELDALDECYRLSPRHGGALWVARKRGMRPQQPCYTGYLPAEVALFDACGPERHDE